MGRIIEFLIFHRNGKCLLDLDEFNENYNGNVQNKAIVTTANKENEHRYKLIYGMLFSMKSFVKTLSPGKDEDALKNFCTSEYKLHYVEFVNGLRFIFLTDPRTKDLGNELKSIHKYFYSTMISKNIFVETDEQIKNENFLEKTYKYIVELNRNL